MHCRLLPIIRAPNDVLQTSRGDTVFYNRSRAAGQGSNFLSSLPARFHSSAPVVPAVTQESRPGHHQFPLLTVQSLGKSLSASLVSNITKLQNGQMLRTDLFRISQKVIVQHPGVPFLHVTGGSCVTGLASGGPLCVPPHPPQPRATTLQLSVTGGSARPTGSRSG